MSIPKLILCLALGCIVTLCQAENEYIPAQTDSLGRRIYVLDTVRVIARSPEETIGAVHLVDFQNERGAASLNLYEGLQGIGGITNTVGTKDESSIRIRGFRRNEVKLLIDGRPLNTGYFGSIDLQQLAPADIKEVQIVKGPGSAVFGSGTMGGVVNIITADPDNSHWLRLNLLTKRNNANRLALSSSHNKSGLGYWIYAARENHEGLVMSSKFPGAPFEGGGVRNHSHKTQYDLQTRLSYRQSDFQHWGFSAGATLVPEKLIPSSIYSLDYRAYKDWMRYWATLEHEAVLSGTLGLSNLLYYDGGRDTYLQYNDAAHEHLNMESDMRYSTLGANPRLEWKPDDRNTVNGGARIESYRSTRKDNGSYPDWTPHWLNLYNVFSQWQYQLSESYSATASLGLSSHQSDLKLDLRLQLEPSLGLIRKWTEASKTTLSVGKNTSYPTMRQLFSADRGNPELLPQHALKAEAEHRWLVQLGSVNGSQSLGVFYNDIRDLIDVVEGTYHNIFAVRSWGAEYSLLLAPFAWWELQADYSCLLWQSAEGYKLTESPRNQAQFKCRFRLPWSLNLSYKAEYSDIRFSQDNSGDYQVLDAYWLHDLSISRKFGKQSITLGLENVLDAYYETEYGYPGAGLNFFLSLQLAI